LQCQKDATQVKKVSFECNFHLFFFFLLYELFLFYLLTFCYVLFYRSILFPLWNVFAQLGKQDPCHHEAPCGFCFGTTMVVKRLIAVEVLRRLLFIIANVLMGYADSTTFQSIILMMFLETELSISSFLLIFLIGIET